MVARSRSSLAQAKRLAVGQYGELWLAYVDAEKTKIDEVAAQFCCTTTLHCPVTKQIDPQSSLKNAHRVK
jgi:hypothetical protein